MATNSTYDARACVKIQPVHIDATTAYAAGDNIGNNGPFKLSRVIQRAGVVSRLQSLTITVKGTNAWPFTMLILNRMPTSTQTDNVALALSNVDVEAIVGVVRVVAGDYYTIGTTKTVACIGGIDALLDPDEVSRDLWAILVCDGTPTPASTQEITIRAYFGE